MINIYREAFNSSGGWPYLIVVEAKAFNLYIYIYIHIYIYIYINLDSKSWFSSSGTFQIGFSMSKTI